MDAKVKHAGIVSFQMVEERMMYNSRARPFVHALLSDRAPAAHEPVSATFLTSIAKIMANGRRMKHWDLYALHLKLVHP